MSGRRRIRSASELAAKGATGTILIALAIVCAIPLVWLLFAPSKTNPEIYNLPALAFGEFGGYVRAWGNLVAYQDGIIVTWFFNTILYAAATVSLAVITSIGAGYALATTRMFGRRSILLLTIISMIVPGAALVLPVFLMLNGLGLVGTPLSVVLPLAFFPFGTYLAFIHFSTSIPRSLLEAARIDGASEWRVFTQIALPLSRSLAALVAFFSFVGVWTNYFLPFIMLNDPQTYTLQLGLEAMLATGITGRLPNVTNLLIPEGALAALIATLPVAIVFIASQRYLARGILGGAVKD